MDFIVFSDDWGAHPSSSQQIFLRIAKENRVLWVNTVGMRTPKLSWVDLRKALNKVLAMLRMAKETEQNAWTEKPALLHVIQPPMLPLPWSRVANRINTASVLRSVKTAMCKLSMNDPIIVTTVPNVCDAVAQLQARGRIYYCVDDFSQWPGLSHGAVRGMEERLVACVDLVLAASPALQARILPSHDRVELLPHGVDLELFQRSPLVRLDWLVKLATPRVGFYGLLDERLDQLLVAQIATALPDWSFVLAGPQVIPMPELRKFSNIHFPGAVPYNKLPDVVREMSALILPYRVDQFTHTLAPLKLNEYILSGLPIVASAISGISAGSELVRIGRTTEDWIAKLIEGLCDDHDVRRKIALQSLRENGWNQVADTLLFKSAQICDAPQRNSTGQNGCA